MHICPRAAGLENDQLSTAWALPHAFAGPIIVAHDLAGAEEDNHSFMGSGLRVKLNELIAPVDLLERNP